MRHTSMAMMSFGRAIHSGLAPLAAAAMNRAQSGIGEIARVAVRHDRPRLIESNPDARHERRRETDKPGIHVVVGCACLSRRREDETPPRAVSRPCIYDVREHHRHLEGGRLRNRACAFAGGGLIQDLAFAVLDAQDRAWSGTMPLFANAP